jgi:hypothetical protein
VITASQWAGNLLPQRCDTSEPPAKVARTRHASSAKLAGNARTQPKAKTLAAAANKENVALASQGCNPVADVSRRALVFDSIYPTGAIFRIGLPTISRLPP